MKNKVLTSYKSRAYMTCETDFSLMKSTNLINGGKRMSQIPIENN
jgi:hypothetical protein